MVGINPNHACHRLNIDPKARPIRQKRRPMNADRYTTLKEEVDKLISNGSIRETKYPIWLSNPVLVKKTKREMENLCGFYRFK